MTLKPRVTAHRGDVVLPRHVGRVAEQCRFEVRGSIRHVEDHRGPDNTLTIEELQIIGREVAANSSMAPGENLSAAEVLGWDSLNHTLIMMELSARYQVEIDPEQTACYRTFGELVRHINEMFGRR